MIISWPQNTKEITNAIRDAIGRDITILTNASGIACTASGCYLNPITNLSTNPFCPVCSGVYWINTETSYIVNAHVTIGYVDNPWRVTGGIIDKGDATVQIEYTDNNLAAVENAVHFLVDGKTYLLQKMSLRGVPEINRIVITLKEQEK